MRDLDFQIGFFTNVRSISLDLKVTNTKISLDLQCEGIPMHATSQKVNIKIGDKKGHNSLSYFLFNKMFRKYLIRLPAFYLIMWLMKLPKNFEKIAILKIG